MNFHFASMSLKKANFWSLNVVGLNVQTNKTPNGASEEKYITINDNALNSVHVVSTSNGSTNKSFIVYIMKKINKI